MSSHRSAFDVLMSKSQSHKKKKMTLTQTSTSSPSPKKIKVGETVNADHSSTPRSDTTSRVAQLKSKIKLLKKNPDDFDPAKVSYWEKGERVPFMFLSLAFDLISIESGRNVITDILCNMLRTIIATTPEDLLPTVYLAANEIAPAHEGVKLGVGKEIIKAIAEAFGRTKSQVEQQSKELGDLGLVAKGCRSSQTMIFMPKPLTVVKVVDTLKQIANVSGKGNKDKKKGLMKGLLVATTDCEPLYVTRLLQEKLRLGFSRQTVLAALGQAAVYNEQHTNSKPPSNTQNRLDEAAKIVKEVYSVLPVYDIIVPALLTSGVWNLPKACSFTPGVPIRLMLANATTSVGKVLDKFKNTIFTCEYKYDGQRAQIHYMEDGTFEIFSRNAERNTEKYPDVALALSRLKKPSVKSFILDCEIVAFDKEKMKMNPFQTLSTRRHNNVDVRDIKTGVCVFAFDLLYLNGQLLIQENLNTRREKLYDSFEEDSGYVQFATAITSSDYGEIQEFLEASVDEGCEGIMVKTLYSDATYEPAKRTNNWLKLKKDYMDSSIGDSLDLVPIAAFHGRGKRTGFYGAFLLACYDVDNEEFQSICKIGTGFSEAELQELSSSLCSNVIDTPKQYYRVDDSLSPDVWLEPTEVWEVKAADLTISPVYHAAMGIVDNDKGISLRFPRLVRVRKDKKPEEATSSDQIAEMHLAQKLNQPSNQAQGDDD